MRFWVNPFLATLFLFAFFLISGQSVSQTLSKDQLILFEDAITKGEDYFLAKDYPKAKEEYQRALSIDPNAKYPKDKLAQIRKVYTDPKDEENFIKAIAAGDNSLAANDYVQAKSHYQTALTIKPDDRIAKQKLASVDKTAEENIERQKQFNTLKEEAIKLFADKNFTEALSKFKEAALINHDDQTIQAKIKETEQIINEALVKDENYNALVLQADEAYMNRDFNSAKQKYNEALAIKPAETYPKNMLVRVDESIRNQATISLEEEAKRQNEAKLAAQKAEEQRLEEERLTAQKAEEQRQEEERLTAQKAEEQRLEEERLTVLKAEEQRLEEERLTAQKAEEQRLEEERLTTQKAEEQRLEEERLTAQNAEEQRLEEERLTAQKAEEQRLEEERLTAQKAEEQRLEEERLTAQKAEEQKITNEQQIAEQKRLEDEYNAAREKERLEAIAAEEKRIADEKLKLEEYEKASEADKEYFEALNSANELYKQQDYTSAVVFYEKAQELKPMEKFPKEQLLKINTLLTERLKNNLDVYNKFIRDADQAYQSNMFDKAMEAYTKAMIERPEETYPAGMMDKIKKLLNDNSIIELANSTTTVVDTTAQKFSFKPVDIRFRKNNYLIIKAKKTSDKAPKVIVTYGKDDMKNGGFVMKGIESSESTDYYLRVSTQDKWYREDNNWITLYPEGGSLEINSLRISQVENIK